jgi:hypothetical protein
VVRRKKIQQTDDAGQAMGMMAGRLAEGGTVAGRRLAVIEDVITSGGQAVESCRQLRAEGATIAAVLCVIDREAGGVKSLGGADLQLRALFTHSELHQEAASADALITHGASLVDVVEAVRALPYGRPSDRSVEGMLRERRGTCSTKHLFLADALATGFPGTEPEIVHRVYTLTRALAAELFGATSAAFVPEDGLVDVHRYLTILVDGNRVAIDATFPGNGRWDGRSPMPLACADGLDHPASDDPDADKRALEEALCDPDVREPFIASLSNG